MRKHVIYCLVALLLIGLVPIGSSAAEDDGIYEVIIYPNGKGIQTLSGEKSLVLGDVEVSYEVDRENNEIDIYFEEPIIVHDVISIGSTIHKNIKFDVDDEPILINDNLETKGFVSAGVQEINLQYENITKVDSIVIQGLLYDFSDSLVLGEPFIQLGHFTSGDREFETYDITDNDRSTRILLMEKSTKRNYVRYNFSKPVRITSYFCDMPTAYNNHLELVIRNGSSDININIDRPREFVDISGYNLNDVRSIRINNKSDTRISIYEFHVFAEELPQEEVINLDYTIEGNNITLSWTNPSSDKFEGVKIYRDGEYIETTTGESFTETLPIGTYQYRITTLEDGQESEGVTIDISVQTIPTPVKGIRINNTTSSSASITWDLNPKAQNISKYIVYVNGEKHGEIETPPYQLEDLETGKKYVVAVSAVNSIGEGDRSDPVSYTPSKIEDLKSTIKVEEILSYISMLFMSVWPLLALTMAIILSPYITSAIKSVVRSRRHV